MYKKIFTILVLTLCLTTVAFAQGQETSQTQTAPLGSSESKLVTAIDIIGNKSIGTNTILSKMKTRIGSPYIDTIINDDFKRLYSLGFFEDIKIDRQDYRGGFKVIVTVKERPIIDKITFAGVKRLPMREKKLKESLKSKETQYLDYPTLAEDSLTIKSQYEKKGFSQVEISYKADIDTKTNKAVVIFTIVENKKIRIKKIFVEGNKAFTDNQILKLMKTKSAWLFNSGVLKEEVLKEDVERVKTFYHRQGFTDVTVDSETKLDASLGVLYINILIKEGNKYLVGSVIVTGNKDIKESDVVAKLKVCLPGLVFSQEGLKDDVGNLQGLYYDRGYISVQIQEATALNPKTGRVDVTYTIKENEVAYVDKIKIKGNIKTKDLVIRRELRIKPGDKFDGEKLKRSRERLYNLGYFDESYGIHFVPEDSASGEQNKKDLVVDLKETKTGSFSFGGGYSTVDQFIGFVEVEQKNFDWKNFPYFTGAGQNLKMRVATGTLSNGFDLSFTEPWMFDYPVSFGFDGYKHTHERESDVGYGYDEDITGGDLRLGKEISEYLKGNLKYRFDNIDISNVSDEASQDLKSEAGSNNISSLEASLSFDKRDSVFDPVKGTLLVGSIENAGGPFGGDKDFMKFFGRASQYFPLMKGSSLEARVRVGIVDPYGDTEKVPIYERFFAGGANTIRGYHERSIGPVDPLSQDPLGGEALLVGNLEYTYPLLKFFKLAVFYDAGNVWSKASDFGSGGFKSGVGLGVRVKTPIGPLMLDYGVPLNKEPGEEDKGGGRFHFSMSHGF